MNLYSSEELHKLLENRYNRYNHPEFIEGDPISIPHQFAEKENREIAGFLTATISWGQRPAIIKNARRLMQLMDNAPFDIVINGEESDIKMLEKFYHRTFNGYDTCFFLKSLRNIYRRHNGLENVFTLGYEKTGSVFEAINFFREIFLENDHLQRVEKHVANVSKGASAKRINMFLRWMVRRDGRGVDFGLWNKIPSSALQVPLDIHTGNVARALGLLNRNQNDRKAVEELTGVLRKFDTDDPVKYDFALFGMGVIEGFGRPGK